MAQILMILFHQFFDQGSSTLTYLLADHDGTLVLSGIDPSAQSMTACQ